MENKTQNSRYRELEDRTENFAKNIIAFCINLKRDSI